MIADLLNVRAWATEPGFAERVFPVALEMISRGRDLSALISDNKTEASLYPASAEHDPYSGLPIFRNEAGKGVASFRISGLMTKTGGLCSYGMRDYAQLIERANKSTSVDAIVIEMDTPGGTTDGTPELGMAIAMSKKPVVVFADGTLASAGYWVASQAAEIVANANNFTKIGSIGTLFMLPNYANVIEAGNLPNVRIIRAPQSEDKAKVNPFEPISAEDEQELLAYLERITENFEETVAAGRGERLQTSEENIFTGKMYDAEIAQELGMIDAVGDRLYAIERAAALAEEQPVPADPGKQKSNEPMKFKNIAALFGLSDNPPVAEEDTAAVEAAEQRLVEMQETIESNVQHIAQLTIQLEAQAVELEARAALIADLQKQLEEAPAGHATTAIHEADEYNDSVHRNTSIDKQKAELKNLSPIIN